MRAVYEISGGKFQELIPMDVREFMQPVDPRNPLVPIPTYVATWEALCKVLAENCARAKAG
jgi:hypothetical protein